MILHAQLLRHWLIRKELAVLSPLRLFFRWILMLPLLDAVRRNRKGNQVCRLSPQTGFLYATVDRGKDQDDYTSRALLHRNGFLCIQRSGCSLGLCLRTGLVVARM